LIDNAVQGAKSAGRVQSVALRLIVDRERTINDFRPTQYHVVSALLEKGAEFEAQLCSVDGKTPKFTVDGKEIYGLPVFTEAEACLNDLRGRNAVVTAIERKEQSKRPQPPFITSTLQQAAATHLGYSPDQTMQLAQRLYENGFITYMRTDGLKINEEERKAAAAEISRIFGANYVPETPNFYKNKVKNAQKAHEPIRPTDITRNALDANADPRQAKLYELIWRRFMASQMAPATIERTTIYFEPENAAGLRREYRFSATSSKTVFKGYLAAWPNSRTEGEEDEVRQLPNLSNGDVVTCKDWRCVSKETQPPPRYNEASLVRELEEKGIGRPSTYAATIRTLLDREYVNSGKAHVLTPTEVGITATDYLLNEVPDFVNVEFTRLMEEALDDISEGKMYWVDEVDTFYKKLTEWLAADLSRVKVVLDALSTVTEWKAPAVGKNGKVIWSDESYYNDMCAAYNEKSVTKPQLATLIRMAISYRVDLPKSGNLPVPTTPDPDEVQGLFNKVDALTLNDWESRFVTSLKQQYNTKGTLSAKQLEILRKIANGSVTEERPNNEAPSLELLTSLETVSQWNPPVKHGKRTYDDKEFINSLKLQLAEKHFLTDRQFDALKKLVRGYREQIPAYADLAAKHGIKDAAPRRAPAAKKPTTKKRASTKAK
jgi:DNA topoisomerase I